MAPAACRLVRPISPCDNAVRTSKVRPGCLRTETSTSNPRAGHYPGGRYTLGGGYWGTAFKSTLKLCLPILRSDVARETQRLATPCRLVAPLLKEPFVQVRVVVRLGPGIVRRA